MIKIGAFTKCEHCLQKPATVKLYKKDSPYSLRICFNCEKQLTSTEQYRHWLTQHLSYSTMKQCTLPSFSSPNSIK